ncbi:MAG: M28 family peptidase [Spirulinaceae cyanobacterium]
MQLINKSALIRLAILFAVLLVVFLGAWLIMFRMPGQSYQGQLPPLQREDVAMQNSLQEDVRHIAVEIGARNVERYEKLDATRIFLETALTQAGYVVKRQEYQIEGKPCYNLEVERLGTDKPKEIVVIGGHYDSAFTSPGANDNGTGVAATLELARIFAQKPTKRTIRFVEFVNEEPPFFWTEAMGSLVYAKRSHQKGENIVAMLSLETMGYFSDAVGSQKYPPPLNLFYPDQGNFIGFIGNLNSGDLVRSTLASFRNHVEFPSQGASLPAWMPGVGWSDHWAFWQQGYKGIMITDTAHFRYPQYHTGEDTIDKIDFDKFARVVAGLVEVISDLTE